MNSLFVAVESVAVAAVVVDCHRWMMAQLFAAHSKHLEDIIIRLK
jgi:hypothetical protein